jgi:hypothetical protein
MKKHSAEQIKDWNSSLNKNNKSVVSLKKYGKKITKKSK